MITTYSCDAANQLVAEESASGTITYTYDPNGNMTVRNDGGARTTYTWDAENRLVGVDLATSGPITMTYDADGLRRRLETPTEDTRFVWDDQNVLLETDDQGATQASYTLAPRRYGDLLSQRRGSDSRFYLFDGLGSTDRLLDEDEAVTDSYTYEAFGTARASSGTTPNPYRYVGRLGYQFDGATGLHYLRARHYNQAVGGFISRDLARDGWNQYAYGRAGPTRFTDASGLIVDSRAAIGGAEEFVSGGARFVYTCRCGWLDRAHLKGAWESTRKMHEYMVGTRRAWFVDPGPQIHAWMAVVEVGPLSLDCWYNYRAAQGVSFPDKASDLWMHLAQYMVYGVYWMHELVQWDWRDYNTGAKYSAFSYEDLVSHWLGVIAHTTYPGTGWQKAGEAIMRDCNAVSKFRGQQIYDRMEASCPQGAHCHRDEQHKVRVPPNGDGGEECPNPMEQAVLWHAFWPSTSKCCPEGGGRFVPGPANLYTARQPLPQYFAPDRRDLPAVEYSFNVTGAPPPYAIYHR